MIDVNILETQIHHGSDYIHCYEATGFSHSDHRLLIKDDWTINFSGQPKDLRVIQKKHQLAFFRARPATMHTIVPGIATEGDVQPPTQSGYALNGTITSISRRYNPRLFSVTAGTGVGHLLALYRSPLGTQIQSAGAILGNIEYESGASGSWAILSLTVTPTVGSPMTFCAQADKNGDFILPLNRLPALDKDAPAPSYAAVLTIKANSIADDAIADPATFVDVQLESISDATVFASSINFAVTPGKITRLFSKDKTCLTLRSS